MNTEPIYLRQSSNIYELLDSLDIKNGIMAEIGVYLGESTELFSLSNKFSKIYAIDMWENGYDDTDLASYGRDMRLVEAEFDIRIQSYPNIIKLKQSSVRGATNFPDNYFDLIYIDANHLAEKVEEDIKTWLPKVKNLGILGGHDYGVLDNTVGVKRIVDTLFGRPDRVYGDSSWVWIKRGELLC